MSRMLIASVLCCSLNGNNIGLFTTKGITALSEGIKQCKTLVSLR